MVGHGRWEREIGEIDFLKLFNTLLYIFDEYDYWAEVIRYEQDNLVCFWRLNDYVRTVSFYSRDD